MEEESGTDIYEMLAKIAARTDDEEDCSVIISAAIELNMYDSLPRDTITTIIDIALKARRP